MSATGVRFSVGAVLLAVLISLTSVPAGNPVVRVLIALLAIAAVAAVTMSLYADYADREESRTPVRTWPYPAPLDERVPGSSPAPAVSFAPPVMAPGPRAPASYELTSAPRADSVPRFGKGARTQQLPWRLPEQPSQVPGITADEAELGALSVRAASLVGPGHRWKNPAEVRQDAYRLGRDATGEHLVVAVADGLSNSSRSDLGAMVAVSSAVSAALELLRAGTSPEQLSAPSLFGAVSRRILDQATERGLSAADVATVLIVAVLPTALQEGEPRNCWVGWVGDASLWQLGEGRWWAMAGQRKQDEEGIASNAVDAVLPRDPQSARSCLLPIVPGDVLTLVTDGVGDGLAGLPALNRFLATEWTSPPPIADFVNHIGYDAEQFTDDRSAVTVWAGRPGPAARPRWPR